MLSLMIVARRRGEAGLVHLSSRSNINSLFLHVTEVMVTIILLLLHIERPP